MVGEETRAALDGELIERQVLAGQRQRPLELGRPGLLGLAGPGIDQVEGIAREVPARIVRTALGWRTGALSGTPFDLERYLVAQASSAVTAVPECVTEAGS